MKRILLVCSTFLLAFSNLTYGWGQTGHRVTGAIAEAHLSTQARQTIAKLLPNESLAEASTYADEMRSNPSTFWQRTASPWHYVTVPEGKTYTEVGAPKKGDSISALASFKKTLLNKKASLAEKQLALRFTIHLIGDLHQPLHAGNGTDKGGNDTKLQFFREDSNLHRVWDSSMIDRKQLSYSEWTKWLESKISEKNITDWHQTEPKTWVAESTKIRASTYPDSDSISYNYMYEQMPVVTLRLQQAGIRIAAYLNEIYAK